MTILSCWTNVSFFSSDHISTEKVSLILTFYPFNYKVKDFVIRSFGILKNDSETSSIFTNNLLISFRKTKGFVIVL